MCRYQFLNIETCHIVIADTHDAASQLGLTEAAVIDATRDVNLAPRRPYVLKIGHMRSAASQLTTPRPTPSWLRRSH